MSAIIAGITHFIQAIVEVIEGVIGAAWSVVRQTLELAFGLVANVSKLFQHTIGFLLENIVIIIVLAALGVGFVTYQARQGKAIGAKKTR